MNNMKLSIPVIPDIIPCGYFDGRTSNNLITAVDLMRKFGYTEIDDSVFYSFLLENGFRRQNMLFYLNECKGCNECTPIRVPVNDFKLSKSQKRVLDKNCDIEIKYSSSMNEFVTEEKGFIFREYDKYHNNSKTDYRVMTIQEACEQLHSMHSGYSQIVDMDYYYNGNLLGVGVIDIAINNLCKPIALSTNYFYYLPEKSVLKRSLGVFSVLKEIELCKKLEIPYYYLGLYLPNCRKMNYKVNYKSYELLQNGKWIKNEECFVKKTDNSNMPI